MTCKDGKPGKTREVLAGLMAKNPEAGARHRLAICCHRSDCGWPCSRMVKGPGLMVWCVDAATGEKFDLRFVLPNPAWACPEEAF